MLKPPSTNNKPEYIMMTTSDRSIMNASMIVMKGEIQTESREANITVLEESTVAVDRKTCKFSEPPREDLTYSPILNDITGWMQTQRLD
jgi:hypothetical protein